MLLNVATFFAHENQSTPPSLSDFGKLKLGKKSDLLDSLPFSNQHIPPEKVDCKIYDAPAIVHFLPTGAARTFEEYAEVVFLPYITHQLLTTERIDVVYDRYIDGSIKAGTREQRGAGTRTKVSARTKMPPKWQDSLKILPTRRNCLPT